MLTAYKEKLINDALADIMAKFPAAATVFAQQDNAPGHRVNEDREVVAASGLEEGRIELINQPPSSLDINVLDLRFINSIQALQDRTTPIKVDDSWSKWRGPFRPKRPKPSTGSAQQCRVFQKLMLARGDSALKLPHLCKQTAARRNQAVPKELPCSVEASQASQATQA